ncbi:MAG: PD-(D/E)XK nuclease family protein, partial [Desulfovibrio sp.]|nr:PD-(D/E)XK nuclease family protein [Desulfovibrio sp.]
MPHSPTQKPSGRKPFLVVPWEENFLGALLDLAREDCAGDLARAVFILPHSRPERYLLRRLAQEGRLPLIPPRFQTIGGLFSLLSRRITGVVAWEAGLLDRVGLLLEAVRAQTADAAFFHVPPDSPPLAGDASPLPDDASPDASPLDDARLFFPWGVRLAALFEECFSQNRIPGNIAYAQGQVTPFAASLLERLSGLYARYAAGLAAREWTTPGRDAALTAEHLSAQKALPEIFAPDSVLYIAGFHALTRTEEILFRHLWQERGARVLLHADAGTARGDGHWSCLPAREWAGRWQAPLVLHRPLPAGNSPPRLRYVEGFDLHSQLAVLREELAAPAQESAGRDAETAVILPDTGLLLPTLHHLPDKECNVSMGYPLARSPLFRLVDTILRLQEGRRGTDYYWRDLVELIRHPYLKMLEPLPENASGGPAPESSLRRALGRLETTLRASGRAWIDPFAALEETQLPAGEHHAAAALTRRILETTLAAFADLRTPKAMAGALEGFCALLLSSGRPLWDRFLIDAECLYRLTQSAIPELARSALAGENLSPASLFALTRQILEAERVPFEATPLVGLQIMGMLETRLLTFRKVFILDATEDRLPGLPEGDPLLPDALRAELGLPGPQTREQVAAYHFFRLLAGTEETVLLWQEAPESPGPHSGGKKRSRFAEELIWAEEQRQGRLLASRGRDGPLVVLENSLALPPRRLPSAPATPAVRTLISRLLARPVSASLLDAYLRCPLQFFQERIVRLAPVTEIPEGEDPLAVGHLLHAALREYYTPLLGLDLEAGSSRSPQDLRLSHQELLTAFRTRPDYEDLRRRLPADSFAMLNAAAEIHLLRYLEKQPPTRPLALETSLTAEFSLPGRTLTLAGTADRLDLRPPPGNDTEQEEACLHILDYKTGNPPTPTFAFWENVSLWDRLQAWEPETADTTILDDLAGRLHSIQLPLYLLLVSLARTQNRLPPLSLP